jgi:hypothetical protein
LNKDKDYYNMASLQDIIKLIGTDDSKAFIMDESGEVKLVVMGVGQYQRLLLGKLKQQIEDVESINRAILEAQLQENGLPKPTETKPPSPKFASMTEQQSEAQKPKRVDMRSEVIDPNFDFDAEVIKPDFDDI